MGTKQTLRTMKERNQLRNYDKTTKSQKIIQLGVQKKKKKKCSKTMKMKQRMR